MPIEVPLACREHFPYASDAACLTKFDDASGAPEPTESHRAGYGSACVYGRDCYLIHGVWSDEEVSLLHITVLEAVITLMSLPPLRQVIPLVTHVLEFTDNRGAEWSFRCETPHAPLL